MPIINGKYVSPTWVNGQNPPIDAQEMQDICDSVAKNQAPTSHASPTKDYGVGNASNYGHVKLSDSADMSLGSNFGTAATPALVALVNDTAHDASLKANQALELAGGKADATVTGTYQGTGKSGPNHKNSLSFSKLPTAIFISSRPYSKPGNTMLTVLLPALQIGYSFSNTEAPEGIGVAGKYNTMLEVSYIGNTVYWNTLGSGAMEQANINGYTYTYKAIY